MEGSGPKEVQRACLPRSACQAPTPATHPELCDAQELEAAQLEEVRLEAAAAAAAAAPAAQEAKPIQAAAAVPALPATPAARPQPAARLAQRQEAGSEGDEEVKAPRAEVAA